MSFTQPDYTAQNATQYKTNIDASFAAVERVFDADVSGLEVVNTITQTTVYIISVPGGTLGTNKALRLTGMADYLNNTGADKQLTILVTFGGVGLTFSIAGITASATRRGIRITVDLSAKNAANAQVMQGRETIFDPSVTGGNAVIFAERGTHNNMAVDSAIAQNLLVQITHSAADVNLSFFLRTARLEYLPF